MWVEFVVVPAFLRGFFPGSPVFRFSGFPSSEKVNTPMGHFRYVKIQPDSEAKSTQTKEMNKHGHSISFVCVL